MDTTTVPAPLAARIGRGLALYRERGEEIVRFFPHAYVVPSCTGKNSYVVRLDRGTCECPDFETRREACKHLYAATIKAARVRCRKGLGA